MEIRPARAGDFEVMWGMFKEAIAMQDALRSEERRCRERV